MKEFVKSQKVTYNLMSFTAFKSLLMFSLLTEGPKSFEEIGQIVENHPYLREKISTDTMRVYINSLKRIGCEVKRIKKEDKISRYVITSNPFELNFTPEELQSVIKVYKTLVKTMDIKDLLFMDNLFEKIGKYIKNNDFIYTMRKISMLRDADKELLAELIDCCDKKYQVTVSYKSSNTGLKDIDIITDKIEISNGKIYLSGIGLEYNQYGIFPIDKIKAIKAVKDVVEIPADFKQIKVLYELNNASKNMQLDDNEKLIKQRGRKAIIEITSSNKFLLRQKFLELGPHCKILEPVEFKDEFINILKDMKAGYYCER